jgi:hypothetical protein
MQAICLARKQAMGLFNVGVQIFLVAWARPLWLGFDSPRETFFFITF